MHNQDIRHIRKQRPPGNINSLIASLTCIVLNSLALYHRSETVINACAPLHLQRQVVEQLYFIADQAT